MENINQQPLSSQQPEKPHKSLTLSEGLKIFIFLILVLLLVGFSIVSYKLGTAKNQTAVQNNQVAISPTIVQLSPIPTSDPTTIWKTYISEKLRIRLTYPPNFSIKETDYPTLQPKQKTVVILTDGVIDIRLENNTPFGSDVQPTKTSSITIDGKEAKQFIRSEAIFTEIIVNDIYYLFSISGANANSTGRFRKLEDDETKLYNQILSTFKFTNS